VSETIQRKGNSNLWNAREGEIAAYKRGSFRRSGAKAYENMNWHRENGETRGGKFSRGRSRTRKKTNFQKRGNFLEGILGLLQEVEK